MIRKLTLLVVLATLPLICRATNITLHGNFTADDSVQLFSVSLTAPAAVDLRSYGYAGGTTSTGTVVPSGGFDTILTLFSASGAFIEDNDEGAGVATDPATGLAADARITTNLTAGNYLLALTQYDNFSIGNLPDGFAETGNPNFTADPSFALGGPCPGNMFRDISGTAGRCRTSSWAVDFVNVAGVTPVAPTPEPSALLLAGLGLVSLLVGRCRRRKTAILLLGLIAALASVPMEAQEICPAGTVSPDYCHVSDFLKGQRSLLDITDLQVVQQGSSGGSSFVQIDTANSVQTVQKTFTDSSTSGLNQYLVISLSAHMFQQSSAVTLTTGRQGNSFAVSVQNIAGVGTLHAAPGRLGFLVGGVVADFNRDGYDDVAFSLQGDTTSFLVFVTANDPTDPSKGLKTSVVNTPSFDAVAAGDFNGDGQQEIAAATTSPDTGGVIITTYKVDPATFAVSAATSLGLAIPGGINYLHPIDQLSLARGRFNTTAHDQLAVAQAADTTQDNDGLHPHVQVIDFDANLNGSAGPQFVPAPNDDGEGYFEIKAGKFGLPNNVYDQIVFHNSSPQTSPGSRFFEILTVDSNTLALSPTSPVNYDQFPCAAGIQVGNFDHRQPDGSTPGQTQHDLNDQVAFLYCSSVNNGVLPFVMNIYSADSTSLSLHANPDSALNLGSYVSQNPSESFTPITLVATDIQGRSLVLGEPTKITIDSTINPNVVVSAPPMHVDFISPSPLTNADPELLNVSVVPDSYNTTYDQENSSNTSTGTTNKTSWSFGATESVNGFLQVGDPDAGEGLKASDTLTAAQNLKGVSEAATGSFSEQKFKLTTTTGLADQIVFTDSQFNIWVYPVIGRTVCPSSKPKCQPNEKVPLTIQFSAPNGQATPINSPGASLPWYQPPWEPGNLFSYPANAAQLQAMFPNLTPRTNAITFASTSGSVTEEATWSGQDQSSSSASFDQDYSFDNNFSVNGAFEFAGIGAGGGYSLDLSGSYGLSSLTETSNQIASSTGLKVSVPGTFANFANYGYLVSPSIMGGLPGPNVVDSPPNTSDKTSVQTYGRLYAMFTVDPLNTNEGAGAWWKQAYNGAPDVALNHPKRWTFTATSLQGSVPSNCLAIGGVSSQYDCVTLNPPAPKDPLGDDFHVMRGLFISKTNPQNQNFQNQGPQLERAKVRDVLNLSARVYNYSLADMPAGTQVYTRFYYMLWDTANAKPVDPSGASTLIAEVTTTEPICQGATGVSRTGPICGFSTSSDQLNWRLVGTQFDTGDAAKFPEIQGGNISLVFWVLVWMQNGNALVPELPNHGLTGPPPAFASWLDAANFECPTSSCYSNNLGIYPGTFYLASYGATPNPSPVSASVNLGKLDLSPSRVGLTDKVTASVMVSAQDGDAGTMSVNFYQGDPKQGGRLFDVERIAHISQDSDYKVSATYRPNTCGIHELFAVINQGKSNEVVRRAHPLRVACRDSDSPGIARYGSVGQAYAPSFSVH